MHERTSGPSKQTRRCRSTKATHPERIGIALSCNALTSPVLTLLPRFSTTLSTSSFTMSSSASAAAPSARLSIGRVEFPGPIIGSLVLFGMWILWVAGSAAPMPLKQLEIFRTIGLAIFQSPWGLRAMFWFAVFLHVVEGCFAFRTARVIQIVGRSDKKWSLSFALFWLVQTSIFGYPSMRLINKQRHEQKALLLARSK